MVKKRKTGGTPILFPLILLAVGIVAGIYIQDTTRTVESVTGQFAEIFTSSGFILVFLLGLFAVLRFGIMKPKITFWEIMYIVMALGAIFYLLGDKIGLFATGSLNVDIDFSGQIAALEVLLVGLTYALMKGERS